VGIAVLVGLGVGVGVGVAVLVGIGVGVGVGIAVFVGALVRVAVGNTDVVTAGGVDLAFPQPLRRSSTNIVERTFLMGLNIVFPCIILYSILCNAPSSCCSSRAYFLSDLRVSFSNFKYHSRLRISNARINVH
jgi:hypothetical protein